MNVDGTPYRSIWLAEDGQTVEIIDQTQLPHTFTVRAFRTVHDAALAEQARRALATGIGIIRGEIDRPA